MSRKTFFWTCILLLCGLLVYAAPLAAQSDVRQIPVDMQSFGGRLSPDGRTLAIFAHSIILDDVVDESQLPIRLIDIQSGEELRRLTGFTDYASDLAFTSDGSRLVSYHQNGQIFIWNTADGSLLNQWITPFFGRSMIQILADDTTLLTLVSGTPFQILLWNLETGHIIAHARPYFDTFKDFRDNYTRFPEMGDIQFSAVTALPDGRLVSATANDAVLVWTLGEPQPAIIRPSSEKMAQFSIRSFLTSPDGQSLIYFDRKDGQTHIWDITALQETQVLPLGGEGLSISPDGSRLAWLARTDENPAGDLYLAPIDDPDSVTNRLTIPPEFRLGGSLAWSYFTPDGTQLVVGGLFSGDAQNAIFIVDIAA